MPLAAGRRDRRITFERAETTQDGYGEEVSTWVLLGRAFAVVSWGAGSERRAAAQEQGSQAGTFRVLATDMTRGVTLKDRLTLSGEVWDLTSIAPIGRNEIEFTAVRAL